MVLKGVYPAGRLHGLPNMLEKQTDLYFTEHMSKAHNIIGIPLSDKFFFKYFIRAIAANRVKELRNGT